MAYIGNQPFTAAFLTDTFSGNGSTVAFTMTVAPANTSSILVAITGVLQDPSTYSVSGTTLTFSAAPPAGTSNISVRYLGIPASGVTTTAYRTVTEFTATAGQTSFSVPSYTVGYVDVYRNGVMLGSADYTATSGTTIVLASGATAGDLVEVISFYVSSVLNAIPATAGSVGTTYLADNSVTTAKIAAGAVIQADLATGVAGTGPAFRAYSNTNQTVSSGTNVKVAIDTEVFDTASRFNNTGSTVGGIPSYAFLPNVAGYYQFSASVYGSSNSALSYNYIQFYKNGVQDSSVVYGPYLTTSSIGSISVLIYLNGTTDYVELYTQLAGSGTLTINAGASFSFFSGVLVRAA